MGAAHGKAGCINTDALTPQTTNNSKRETSLGNKGNKKPPQRTATPAVRDLQARASNQEQKQKASVAMEALIEEGDYKDETNDDLNVDDNDNDKKKKNKMMVMVMMSDGAPPNENQQQQPQQQPQPPPPPPKLARKPTPAVGSMTVMKVASATASATPPVASAPASIAEGDEGEEDEDRPPIKRTATPAVVDLQAQSRNNGDSATAASSRLESVSEENTGIDSGENKDNENDAKQVALDSSVIIPRAHPPTSHRQAAPAIVPEEEEDDEEEKRVAFDSAILTAPPSRATIDRQATPAVVPADDEEEENDDDDKRVVFDAASMATTPSSQRTLHQQATPTVVPNDDDNDDEEEAEEEGKRVAFDAAAMMMMTPSPPSRGTIQREATPAVVDAEEKRVAFDVAATASTPNQPRRLLRQATPAVASSTQSGQDDDDDDMGEGKKRIAFDQASSTDNEPLDHVGMKRRPTPAVGMMKSMASKLSASSITTATDNDNKDVVAFDESSSTASESTTRVGMKRRPTPAVGMMKPLSGSTSLEQQQQQQPTSQLDVCTEDNNDEQDDGKDVVAFDETTQSASESVTRVGLQRRQTPAIGMMKPLVTSGATDELDTLSEHDQENEGDDDDDNADADRDVVAFDESTSSAPESTTRVGLKRRVTPAIGMMTPLAGTDDTDQKLESHNDDSYEDAEEDDAFDAGAVSLGSQELQPRAPPLQRKPTPAVGTMNPVAPPASEPSTEVIEEDDEDEEEEAEDDFDADAASLSNQELKPRAPPLQRKPTPAVGTMNPVAPPASEPSTEVIEEEEEAEDDFDADAASLSNQELQPRAPPLQRKPTPAVGAIKRVEAPLEDNEDEEDGPMLLMKESSDLRASLRSSTKSFRKS